MVNLAPARVDVEHFEAPARRRSAVHPIRRVVVSVLLTLVTVNLLVVLIEPYFLDILRYDQQYTSARIVEYYSAPPPDIMFMGTSRAVTGFNPAVMESEIEALTGTKVSAHNMGVTGGTIEVHYLILKNIIRDDKKPRVIVYGVTDSEFANIGANPVDYLPYTSPLLRMDDFWRYSGPSLNSKLDFLAKQLLPLYRDRRIIRDALSIAFDPNDPSHKYYAPGPSHHEPSPDGFIPSSGHARAPQAQIDQNRGEYGPLLSSFRYDYRRLDLFHEFLALAERRGIKVVLVNMPVDAELRKLWGSEDRVDEYRAMMQVLADDHHVPLLDLYRGWDGFPSDGLWDWHHLNEVGAGAVTKLVADTYVAPMFGGAAVAQAPAPVIQAASGAVGTTGTAGTDTGREVFIQATFPDSAKVGVPFNLQPDGTSALAVRVRNATATSTIVFAGTPLDTVYNPDNLLTAKLPTALIAAPGRYPVSIVDGTNESNTVDFVVNGQ